VQVPAVRDSLSHSSERSYGNLVLPKKGVFAVFESRFFEVRTASPGGKKVSGWTDSKNRYRTRINVSRFNNKIREPFGKPSVSAVPVQESVRGPLVEASPGSGHCCNSGDPVALH